MLAEPDPQALTYYPAMFFALADLVTYFGQLVYDRLGKLILSLLTLIKNKLEHYFLGIMIQDFINFSILWNLKFMFTQIRSDR